LAVDDRRRSSLYEDGFSELCGWLESYLHDGFLISLVMVKEKYQEILQSRNQSITEGMVRTKSIRDRLQTKFQTRILFTKLNNRQGLFISWNDLSLITRVTLTNSSLSNDDYPIETDHIYNDQDHVENREAHSKTLFQAAELLRQCIRENMHYLKQADRYDKSLPAFTSGLFWDCIPKLVKNFLGLLTANDDCFQHFKNDSDYSDLLNKDMYRDNDKALKISSIAYDIINARYDSYSTPKHVLLGNELFHHVRSSHLVNIMNRFGHTCSYETLVSQKTTFILNNR
jgi:hypothetical protein